MAAASLLDLETARNASGTAWQPVLTPHAAYHHRARGWDLMFHALLFGGYDYQASDRGDQAAVGVGWVMGMAGRRFERGALTARVMLSPEAWTASRDGGYPLLLQSGETYQGVALHDRQHPHDLFMEIGLHLHPRPRRRRRRCRSTPRRRGSRRWGRWRSRTASRRCPTRWRPWCTTGRIRPTSASACSRRGSSPAGPSWRRPGSTAASPTRTAPTSTCAARLDSPCAPRCARAELERPALVRLPAEPRCPAPGRAGAQGDRLADVPPAPSTTPATGPAPPPSG